MPSNVKLFWWLSVAIVACWIFWVVWLFAFPPHFASLAHLPPEIQNRIREQVLRTGVEAGILSTLLWGGLSLGFSWLAAFRRENWARWAFLAVFIIRESIPLAISVAYYHNLDFFMRSLSHENWTDPWGYAVLILTIAAIGFAFSGSSRRWFNASAATA
jgi:hypothetical protein